MKKEMLGSIAIMISFIETGCSKETQPLPISTNVSAPIVADNQPNDVSGEANKETTTPSFGATVYIDTSASMAGFFPSKRRFQARGVVTALHAEIEAVLMENGLGSAKKCTIGIGVDCDKGPRTPAELGEAKHYTQSASRLDEVLKRVPPPTRTDPNLPIEPDRIDDAKVTIIVTDGMQASPGAANIGDGPVSQTPCARGADPVCINTLLEARISEGYGLWMVGILLPFDGVHYPEMPVIEPYFQETIKHVAELKYDIRNLGVEFGIRGKLVKDRTSDNTHFRYQGFKPLLMIILTRDVSLGRNVVEDLARRLEAAPIIPGRMKPGDAVKSLEIAPLTALVVKPITLQMPGPKEQTGIDPTALAEFRLEGVAPIPEGVSSKVWCGARGAGLLQVRLERRETIPLPEYLREEVQLTQITQAPERSVAPPVSGGPDSIKTGVNCTALPMGHTEVRFQVETRMVLDETRLATAWWSRAQWSGENSWETPERLFGLERLILPLLQARSSHSVPWGEVRIHVQRE